MKYVYVFNFTQNFHHFKSKVSEAPFHSRPQTAIPSVLHATDWGITGTHLGDPEPLLSGISCLGLLQSHRLFSQSIQEVLCFNIPNIQEQRMQDLNNWIGTTNLANQ